MVAERDAVSYDNTDISIDELECNSKVKKTHDITLLLQNSEIGETTIDCILIENLIENAEEITDWHSSTSYGLMIPDELVLSESFEALKKIIALCEELIKSE